MAKEIKAAIGVHVDAVAGWLGSYGGEGSPADIQRGMFAGEVGIPRLLEFLARRGMKATWFFPGHSIETFPRQTDLVVAAGHELGAHGYSHENPVAMSLEQERDVLGRCVELVVSVSGKPPRSYVAPWWELSDHTPRLLLEYGFTNDQSQFYNDFTPFYARIGDAWTAVDYSKPAIEWMKPLIRGEVIDLVEVAANWYLDDLPPMMFIKKFANSHGFVIPDDIERLWRAQFDWVYRELDYAVFPLTIHPDVSGRPQVLIMLERLVAYISAHPGVEWTTFESIARDFRARHPFVDERIV